VLGLAAVNQGCVLWGLNVFALSFQGSFHPGFSRFPALIQN